MGQMNTTAAKLWQWLLLPSLLASLQLASVPLRAQTPAVRFEHLSVEDGLSHSAVNAIEQDRHGFLWFATRNGLNRYDGYRFRVFQHDPEDRGSLPHNSVFTVLEDRRGELWVVTQSGLDRFDRAEERFIRYRHDPEDPRSISNDVVTTLYEDRAGNLWIGTYQGLNRLEPDGTFVRYPHDPGDEDSLSDPRVLALAEDRENRFWVGTYGGLDLLDRRSGTLRHYRNDPADPSSLSDNLVNAIQEDADGALWVATARGLNRFDGVETFTRYRHGPVDLTTERAWQLFVDRGGELWVGTVNAGLIRIPRGGGSPTQYRHDAADPWSLNGDRVLSIFEDQSGILWASTYLGLNKYDRRREQFAIYRREPGREQTLTDSNTSAILEDRSGELWVGTWDKGLNSLDRERGTVVHYQPDSGDPRSLPDDTVQALCEDLSGALWVATWGGLARLDAAREGFTVYRPDPQDPTSLDSDAVNTVYRDRRGRIWVGTILGLSRFEPASDSFVRYRLGDELEPSAEIILEDQAGTLWVGSLIEGLFYLDSGAVASSRDLIHRRHDPADDHSLGGNAVSALYEDRSGNLWIGTGDAGLDRLDPARERFAHYRQADGLASDQVLGILEDDAGRLWLSTSHGLSRLDPRTGTFRNFGVKDGLQSNVFSYRSAFRNPRGEMFFGGTHGFNAFFPDQIETDPFVPPVVLTDFQLFNQTVSPRRLDPESPLERSILDTSEIRLSHRHNVFSLEFAALHYASPRQNRYAYRLEGFDDDWITTGADRRLATYTNLDAGSYRFRVRGGNPDGVWNEQEATVRIVVAPPPWKSWWAYTLYTLAVSAVVLGAIRSQRRKLERERTAREKELAQERAVNRRLREVDGLKDEFLANTSHELRTPLYGITGLAESLIDGAAGELPEAARANLGMLVTSGRRLTALVNDILDFSKLKHHSLELDLKPVDLHALVDVVLTLSRPLVGSKQLELVSSVPAGLPAVEADENRLQQILHNLVGNAVKFTESGQVEVTAAVRTEKPSEEGRERIVVGVRDTGIGISENQRERIFEAFAQADASIEREFGGTGLGLAVSRRLVALHGGCLCVESVPGEGSAFFFDLEVSGESAEDLVGQPATARPAAIGEADPTTRLAEEAQAATLGGARLLVVDDEPIVRQVVTNQLTAHGFRVTPAASGPEALRLIGERTIDLVILDVMMPRMSGFEVCRELRRRYPLEELPIIFLTAKNQAEDLVVGLAAGANDYLPKPVSKSELLARVQTHVALLLVNRQLSGMVAERTSQLAERERLLGEREQLISVLESRNAELARFNYTVAHDLKNPLTTIRNFVGRLGKNAETDGHDRLRGDLRRIDDAALQLHRLLDELYEYSRIDRVSMPCQDMALSELVRQAVAEIAPAIAEREVEAEVEVEVAPDLPSVCGDPVRLLEAVRHLLGNAVQYLGDQSAPRIEVGMRGAETPEEPPTFYVRDNGTGIDPKYHEKIFGLFERLEPGASEGTGIGLALVKRIIEVHGGRIWVESEGRGKGSTFCFTLPLGGPVTDAV